MYMRSLHALPSKSFGPTPILLQGPYHARTFCFAVADAKIALCMILSAHACGLAGKE